MPRDPQIDQLANDIDALINRYRLEYDLTYAAVVGVLQMRIWLLCNEADGREGEVQDA